MFLLLESDLSYHTCCVMMIHPDNSSYQMLSRYSVNPPLAITSQLQRDHTTGSPFHLLEKSSSGSEHLLLFCFITWMLDICEQMAWMCEEEPVYFYYRKHNLSFGFQLVGLYQPACI
jgi:hypothetical protein